MAKNLCFNDKQHQVLVSTCHGSSSVALQCWFTFVSCCVSVVDCAWLSSTVAVVVEVDVAADCRVAPYLRITPAKNPLLLPTWIAQMHKFAVALEATNE
jgi:hypothetical protein